MPPPPKKPKIPEIPKSYESFANCVVVADGVGYSIVNRVFWHYTKADWIFMNLTERSIGENAKDRGLTLESARLLAERVEAFYAIINNGIKKKKK